MLENNPRKISARRNGMALSAVTFNKITLEEMCWYPYNVKVRQQLKGNDLTSLRFQICYCKKKWQGVIYCNM